MLVKKRKLVQSRKMGLFKYCIYLVVLIVFFSCKKNDSSEIKKKSEQSLRNFKFSTPDSFIIKNHLKYTKSMGFSTLNPKSFNNSALFIDSYGNHILVNYNNYSFKDKDLIVSYLLDEELWRENKNLSNTNYLVMILKKNLVFIMEKT
jgi:hypothetical protein